MSASDPTALPRRAALDLRPQPGAAPAVRRELAQARFELRLLVRNGEQVLLTLILPAAILIGAARVPIGTATPAERIAQAAPAVLAIAILSTAFTGQAIATGFERRYGVLERLATTPLGRSGLLAGKTAAVLALEVAQIALLCVVAAILGWQPTPGAGGVVAAALLVVVATAAFSALGLLMAGTLRAEATLAAANLLWLASIAAGGVITTDVEESGPTGVLELTPLGALVAGLRTAFAGHGWPWADLVVLMAWLAVAGAAAVRWFRWR
jgi:ABC-2 type transport system permease protein